MIKSFLRGFCSFLKDDTLKSCLVKFAMREETFTSLLLNQRKPNNLVGKEEKNTREVEEKVCKYVHNSRLFIRPKAKEMPQQAHTHVCKDR